MKDFKRQALTTLAAFQQAPDSLLIEQETLKHFCCFQQACKMLHQGSTLGFSH